MSSLTQRLIAARSRFILVGGLLGGAAWGNTRSAKGRPSSSEAVAGLAVPSCGMRNTPETSPRALGGGVLWLSESRVVSMAATFLDETA